MTTIMNTQKILNTYHPVYGGESWEEVHNYLMSDPIDKAIIEELVKVLQTEGEYRDPILLHDHKDSEDLPWVLDGTHRIVAAMITKTQNLKIAYFTDRTPEEYPLKTLVTRLSPAPVNDEDQDNIQDSLRSLKIDSDNWITSTGSIITNNTMEIFWDNYAPELLSQITNNVISVIHEQYPHIMVSTVTTYVD